MKKIIYTIVVLFIVHCILNIDNCEAQWEPNVLLGGGSSSNCYAQAWNIASSGNFIHVVYFNAPEYNNLEIYYIRSTDGGSTWGTGTRLTNSTLESYNPAIDISGSVVHVVWHDYRDGNYEIYYKRSTDYGTTWGADTRLTNNSAWSINACVTVSGLIVHVVWGEGQPFSESLVFYKRSTDGGLTWGANTQISNNSSSRPVHPSIKVSGSVLHLVYDVMDRDVYYNRSTDGGTTWGTAILIRSFEVGHLHNPNVAFSGSVVHVVWHEGSYAGGAYYRRSTDEGITWGGITNITNYEATTSIAASGAALHLVSGGKYKRSINAGISWEPIIQVFNGENQSIAVSGQTVHVVFHASGNMYYKRNLTANSAVKAILNSIYRPNDSWTQTYNITLHDSLCIGMLDSVWWYVNDSLVGRQHSMTYPYRQGTTFVKLKVKNNFGNTDSTTATITRICWKKYTSGQILAGLSLIGDSIFYVISTGDAVYRMDINGNLIYPLTVLGNVLSSCSIAYDTNVFIASDANYLYGFNRYGGQLWTQISLGGQATATPTVDSVSNRLYIGVSNGNFQAYNKVSGTYAWSTFLNAPVRSSAVVSYDRKLVVASAIGTVYGFNLNNPIPTPPNWTLNLSDSILVSPCIDTMGYFYFGSRSGKVYKIALTGTSNAGIVWQTPLSSAVTSSPTIDANGNIYVGTADGKFYSLNKNGGIRWFFQTPATIKSTAAITTYQRIYFGNDAGEIYGLDTNKIVRFYYIDSSKVSCAMLHHKGTLYFGNEAGRIFALFDLTGGSKGPVKPVWGTFQNNIRRTGNQIDEEYSIEIKKISEYIPDKFELSQNYPNPFNPTTRISFKVASYKVIKLQVFDILGKEITTLVNEKLQPGTYETSFDASKLPSGIYFYRLSAGDFSETKKLTLIK